MQQVRARGSSDLSYIQHVAAALLVDALLVGKTHAHVLRAALALVRGSAVKSTKHIKAAVDRAVVLLQRPAELVAALPTPLPVVGSRRLHTLHEHSRHYVTARAV
jgi:hypothetical protein